MLILNLQFWSGDMDQAMALARLIADMEPAPRTDVTFLFTARFDCEHDQSTVDYVREKFPNTFTYRTKRKGTGWPVGCNIMYADSYQFCIEAVRAGIIKGDAVLFMEADCVPLDTQWINLLISEYKQCGKPILGAFIRGADGWTHVNGNCIIAIDFWKSHRTILNPGTVAWDADFASIMVPNAAPSRLIYSDYHLGTAGKNEWKGCEYLFADKSYPEGHPLYGEVIKPAWFHGPKGMLGIECVRNMLFTAIPLHQERNLNPIVPEIAIKKETPVNHMETPITDIFVVTYAKDAKWLEYLLRSIQKYAVGFRKTIIAYPNHDQAAFTGMLNRFPNTEFVGFDQASDGHIHQNVIKCMADTYSDAQYFLHIDSDCVFTDSASPLNYFTNDKPDLIFQEYTKLVKVPWQQITERALGINCPFETMRRFPFIYPRELYKAMRDRVEEVHHMPFSQYAFTAPNIGGAWHGFSEFNALGCTGMHFHPEWFNLVDVASGAQPSKVRQYWSWSGLTDQERFELEQITQGYQK